MCIQTKIQRYIEQKAELDAKIAKLEELENATAPVKNLLAELLADYAQEAPEDLAAVWEEVLAIGGLHNLSVRSLAVDELRQWEADRAELEKLKNELEDSSANWSEKYPSLYSEATATLADEEYVAAVEEELALDDNRKDIPALTLWQPWASLVAQEVKRVETRSWSTNYRGPLAIHAAKRFVDWCTLNEDEYVTPDGNGWPLGAVVAIVNLVDCVQMTPEFIASQSQLERQLGIWQPGRFAWILENIRPVVPPIPAKGGQKLWNWAETLNLEFPDPTAEQIEEELGCNWEDKEETAPEQTELQKLLAGNSHIPFIFESAETGIDRNTYVSIYSVIAPADDTVEFQSEEAKIKVAIGNSKADIHEEREYFVNAQTFMYQHKDNIRSIALGYVKCFLLELKKESEIQEKIRRWNADDARPIESVDLGIQEPETDGRFTTMGFKVEVHLQPPTGLTFRFLNPDDNTLVFSNSLITAELADRTWKVCAGDLITVHREREAARLEKIANPYATEEDKFIELVKLSPAVGYIKRRDNGEMLSAYAAFANRNTAGEKTVTLAKSRSKKWAEYLHSSFESCGWKVEEPRKINRMVAELGARQQFAYEIKITGKFSIGQLQKLAEEDFSLLPGEVAATETVVTVPPASASTQDYRVRVNGYELATGTEEEMRSRFEEELKILGGSQMSVSLLTGSEVVESYRISDFQFTQIEDFDAANPEYETTYLPSQKSFKVYKNLGLEGYPTSMSGWTNTLYPYTPGFTQRVAAAADAIRRLSKAQDAAE